MTDVSSSAASRHLTHVFYWLWVKGVDIDSRLLVHALPRSGRGHITPVWSGAIPLMDTIRGLGFSWDERWTKRERKKGQGAWRKRWVWETLLWLFHTIPHTWLGFQRKRLPMLKAANIPPEPWGFAVPRGIRSDSGVMLCNIIGFKSSSHQGQTRIDLKLSCLNLFGRLKFFHLTVFYELLAYDALRAQSGNQTG